MTGIELDDLNVFHESRDVVQMRLRNVPVLEAMDLKGGNLDNLGRETWTNAEHVGSIVIDHSGQSSGPRSGVLWGFQIVLGDARLVRDLGFHPGDKNRIIPEFCDGGGGGCGGDDDG